MNATYIKYPGPTRTITKSTKIKKKKNNPSFKQTIDLYGLLRKVKITRLKDF